MNLLYIGRYKDEEVLTGPQKFAKRLFGEMSKMNNVTFISYYFEGALYSRWKKLFGYEIINLLGKSKVLRLGIIPFIYYLLLKRFDIVHILNFERFAFLASKLKFIGGYKLAYTSHGLQRYEQPNFYPNIPKRLQSQDVVIEDSFFSKSDTVVFVSDLYRQFCIKQGCKPINSSVIIHGIDDIFFDDPLSQKIEKPIHVLFVANVNRKEKGFQFFAETINQFKNNIVVNIVSETKPTIEFNKNVICNHFTPMEPNRLAKQWSTNDIVILSSIYEPFSITTIEAMANGIIPFVSSSVGMANLIQDGVNGIIFEPGDHKKVVSWLETLSHDMKLLNEMKIRSRASVQSLRWYSVAQQYVSLYERLL